MFAELRNLITGAVNVARGSYDNSVVTQDGHARYQEAVLRGNCFISTNQTGVTTQAGLSGTTPGLTLANPKGNNKNLVLWFAAGTHNVANATASVTWLAANINNAAAAVTGTVATFSNCLVGNTNSPSAQILTAATLPAAPIAIATLGFCGTVAVTTPQMILPLGRFFDGLVCVAPGGALSIQTSAASGTNGLFSEFVWEEVPFNA